MPASQPLPRHRDTPVTRQPRAPQPHGGPAPSRLRSRVGSGQRRDQGSLTLEVAILFVVVMALTFGALQVGLWYSARNMCQAAAEAGTRAGRVQNAPAGAGASAARTYLVDVAGGLVVDPQVTETRTATTVTVACSGQAQNVVPSPGFDISLAQTSTAGIERFTTR